MLIRATLESDTAALLALAEETRAFKPIEIQALREVLDDFHRSMRQAGHQCVTAVKAEQIQGFAYYAPAAMTDRTWYLYWIAVRPDRQNQGTGTQLLTHCEQAVQAAAGRLLLVETSSLPHYEPTRRFYLRRGYAVDAVLHDYYAPGDDMLVFRKAWVA